jgi:hypothetical protein
VKEIEKNIIEGWTINPPENMQRARQWIKTIEAIPELANPSGDRQMDQKGENEELFKL